MRVLLFLVAVLTLGLAGGCNKQSAQIDGVDLPKSVFKPSNKQLSPAMWDLQPLLDTGGMPQDKFIAVLWASWCLSCMAEHKYLVQLAEQGIPMVGISFKDKSVAALQALDLLGNPFRVQFADKESKLATQLGGNTTPHAFVIDAKHRLRATVIGGINQRRWEEKGLGEWFANL